MKIIIALLVFMTSYSTLFSQDEEKQKSNLVYLQAGGPSIIGSINYERILFTKEKTTIGLRFGIGTTRFKDFTQNFNPDLTIPLGVIFGYTFKRLEKSAFAAKIELGNTFASVVVLSEKFSPARQNSQSGCTSIGAVWLHKKGYYIGLAYTPMLVRYKTFRHWGSLSLGCAF